MPDVVQRTIEILESSQYRAELQKIQEREAALAKVREEGGKAGVKAYNDVEKAAAKQAAGVARTQAQLDKALVQEAQEIDAITAKWQEAINAQRGYDRAASAATGTTKNLSAGMTNLSFQLNDVVSGLVSGQKPMQVFTQQGGQIFQAFQMTPGLFGAISAAISSVAEVGASALIPFLSVAGPLWYDYSQAQEQANDAAAAWVDIELAAEPLVKQAQKDVEKLTKLLNGASTEEEERTRILKEYDEQLRAANEPLHERIDLLQQELDTMAKTDSRYDAAVVELQGLQKELQTNNRVAAEGALAAIQSAEYTREEAEATRVLAERKRKAAAARKSDNEEARKAKELAELRLRLLKQEADAESAREKAQAKAEAEFAKRKDRIDDIVGAEKGLSAYEAQEEREEIVRLANIAQAAADTADEKKHIARQLQEALAEIGQQEVLQARKDEEEKTKKAKEEAKKRLDAQLGFASDMSGQLADLASSTADAIGSSNSEAALKAWQISQGLAIVEATVAAYKAGAETMAAVAAIPGAQALAIPAGIAMAAAVEAASVAKIAATSPPAFDDTPGVMQVGRGRQDVNFASGDLFLAAKTTNGLLGQMVGLMGTRSQGGRRSRLRDQLALNPLQVLGRDMFRALRGGA